MSFQLLWQVIDESVADFLLSVWNLTLIPSQNCVFNLLCMKDECSIYPSKHSITADSAVLIVWDAYISTQQKPWAGWRGVSDRYVPVTVADVQIVDVHIWETLFSAGIRFLTHQESDKTTIVKCSVITSIDALDFVYYSMCNWCNNIVASYCCSLSQFSPVVPGPAFWPDWNGHKIHLGT